MTSRLASGLTDTNGSGKFVNSGTIGAAVPTTSDTAMNINGNLVLKDGSSLAYSKNNGYVGKIAATSLTKEGTVNLTLNANGSYNVKDVLTNTNFNNWVSVNGTATNIACAQSENDTVYKTDLMTARYSTANDGTISFNLENNLENSTEEENRAFSAIKELSNQGKYDENLQSIYNLQNGTGREAIDQLVSNGNAQSTLAMSQSNFVGQTLGQHWSQVQRTNLTLTVPIKPAKFADDGKEDDGAINVQVPIEVEPVNSFWVQTDKGWGNIGNNATHMYGITLGHDKRYDESNRGGVFFGFARSNYSGTNVVDKMQDYRLGYYNGYHNGARAFLSYIDFGIARHDAKRYRSYWGTNSADYNSKTIELGAEYKYDLHANDGKIFHVAPYINGKFAHYWQDSYQESGAFGDYVHSYNGNYAAAEIGMEVSRKFPQGSYSARLGYKKVFTGNSTDLTYNIAGTSVVNTSSATSDRHFVTANLTGSMPLNQHGLSLEGNAHIEKGAHDKNYGVSATIKWEW